MRLRPLKGVVSVAGTDLKLLSSSSRQSVSVLELKGFSRLQFRFETRSESQPSKTWIVIDSADNKVIATVEGHGIDVRGDGLRVDLRPAPRHVRLVAVSSGRKAGLNLVGILPIEQYLEGVVASEVPTDWPMEALKAQAVAARSFALAKIRERSRAGADWLLESNVTDQVFDYERVHSRSSEAVRATKGEVLEGSDGRIVAANYHADCGGQTDEARTIWGGGVKTGTAVDQLCSSARSPWRFVRSLSEVSTSLAEAKLLPGGFKIASLAISHRTEGGRALRLQARSAGGGLQFIEGERFRAALGYSDLKSTLFEVRKIDGAGSTQIEIVGRGFGHGTGLCQWGSLELARSGKSYRQILQHYYPRLIFATKVPLNGPTNADSREQAATNP